jgi:threonine/homoserine/homoserine lactone efflux protein
MQAVIPRPGAIDIVVRSLSQGRQAVLAAVLRVTRGTLCCSLAATVPLAAISTLSDPTRTLTAAREAGEV